MEKNKKKKTDKKRLQLLIEKGLYKPSSDDIAEAFLKGKIVTASCLIVQKINHHQNRVRQEKLPFLRNV